MPTKEEDLIRIATIFLQIPGNTIEEYVGSSRYQELLECYIRLRKTTQIPPQLKMFEEKVS